MSNPHDTPADKVIGGLSGAVDFCAAHLLTPYGAGFLALLVIGGWASYRFGSQD